MAGAAEIIRSLATLIWPMIVAMLAWKAFPILKSIMSSRSFSVKIAGMELSVQDATEQIQRQIADLQQQVIRLRSIEDAAGRSPPLKELASGVAEVYRPRRILWVDDKPTNIAMEISQLNSIGVEVIQVQSTKSALEVLDKDKNFIAIISDMVRQEENHSNPRAGLALLQAIRSNKLQLPFIVFTSAKSQAETDQIIKQEGGVGAISSSLRLIEWVESFIAEASEKPNRQSR